MNRRLHESCDWSEQCTGSIGANECNYKYGLKICSCPADKDIFNGTCLKGKGDETYMHLLFYVLFKQYSENQYCDDVLIFKISFKSIFRMAKSSFACFLN